ncbi:hypothetical protein BaRGS_00034588, partial [Batillaria attramentaria]
MAEIDDEVMKACSQHMRSVCGNVLDTYRTDKYTESADRGDKYDYIINDLTEFSVEKDKYGFSYDFQTNNVLMELSFRCLKEGGKYLARGNCLSAYPYIEKIEREIKPARLQLPKATHPLKVDVLFRTITDVQTRATMLRTITQVLFCFLVGFCGVPGSEGLQWESSNTGLSHGATVTACVGQTVLLNWTYVLDAGEHIEDIQWELWTEGEIALCCFIRWGHSDEMQAILVEGSVLPVPGASKQLQFVSNAGIRLVNVTSQDAGTYSVRMNVNLHGSITTDIQTADLKVAERLTKCQASKSDMTSRLASLSTTSQQQTATIQSLTHQLNTC